MESTTTAAFTGNTSVESEIGDERRMTTHKTGTIVAIISSATCGLLVLLGLVYLMYKLYRRGLAKDEEYEKILPDRRASNVSPSLSADSKAHINSSLGMRTIPFQVPPSPRPTAPRGAVDGARLQDDTASQSSMGSEPASPLGGRGSLDSVSSSSASECRGAYALGSIDPSLYKMVDADDDYDIPEDHIGRIWFAVEYERESEKLMVTLIKAKNLPSRVSGANSGCDPFVKIYLMPDERRYLQSKFKKKTCNPKFEESFVFQVSNKGLDERMLKLSVYDVDRHKRHSVIGHALYALQEHNYESNERVVIWRDVEREVSETTKDKGDIHISLSYNDHLERLTVGVFEGKNFKTAEGFPTPDVYVKVNLHHQGKLIKSKKSDVVRKTTNPAFNESFIFKMTTTSIDIASIGVTVMQHFSGQKDKTIGRVVLGSFMFARGKELEHWTEMLSNQRDQVSQWHVMT